MFSRAEVDWDLALYAQEWLEERFRLTLKLVSDVDKKASTRTVHDLRVACRRLREAISFFLGVTEVPPLSDVDRAARRMARAVRRLRETDVAIKRLRRLHVEGRIERGELLKRTSLALAKRRQELAEEERKRISKRAGGSVRDQKRVPLRVRLSADVDPAREAELRAFVEARVAIRRAEVQRLFYLVRSRGGKIASNREADHLHGIRVAIKHWRYAGEIARAVMPRVLYRPMSVKLRHLQDLGGESQDFADLASVVEKELADGGTREQRSILAAVRAERARAARAVYDALTALLPSSRAANGG
jgi:CHAD domain-containing protein